jgi:hypothetical protein
LITEEDEETIDKSVLEDIKNSDPNLLKMLKRNNKNAIG